MSESNAPQSRPSLRRPIMTAIIGGALVVAAQLLAPVTDYQYAFFATALIGLVTAALVLFGLQRVAKASGQPWVVPIVSIVGLLVFGALVRMKTLSGEMVPQLEWRFASRQVPKIQRPMDIEPRHEAVDETAMGEASDSSEQGSTVEQGSPDSEVSGSDPIPWTATWSQFLGNDRNGIIADREFSIPDSPGDVEKLWTIGMGGGWSSFAVAQKSDAEGIAITLEQREDRECVTAYDLLTGKLLWLVAHEASHFHALGEGGPRTTPTIVGDRVYAQGATGFVWCLDLETGTEVWTRDLLEAAGWEQLASEVAIAWGRSGSPLLVDGLCVIPFGGDEEAKSRSLIALDATTGETRWSAGEGQISYASPQLMTLGGVRQIVSVNEADVTGHVVESGEELWKTDWAGQSNGGANCASAIPAGKDRFLIGKGYAGGSALIEVSRDGDRWKVEDVWRSTRVLKTKFNHCVIRDGVAYGLSNGALQAVDVEPAKRLWTQGRRGRFGQGQVILAGDTLIVQAEMGEVAIVEANPDEFVERIRFEALQQKTWNIPTLVGRILLVRNGEQAIAYRMPER